MITILITYIDRLTDIILIITGIIVIMSKKMITGMLGLIIGFLSIVIKMIIKGKWLIGIIMMMLYVGAIAVIILYVIMMMRIKEQDRRMERGEIILMWIIIMITMMNEIQWNTIKDSDILFFNKWIDNIYSEDNIKEYIIMYREYGIEIIIMSVILISGLIGGIVVTSKKENRNKEEIYHQVDIKIERISVVRKF